MQKKFYQVNSRSSPTKIKIGSEQLQAPSAVAAVAGPWK